MCVLAADLFSWHIEHQEKSLRLKRNLIDELASGQPPAALPSNKPAPRTAITPNPQNPSNKPRSTHTQFAPPPGGKGRWDPNLGVYVIQGQKDLYYRQRTYYHWDGAWYWGVSPQGPWTATDANGVPPGLSRRYAQP